MVPAPGLPEKQAHLSLLPSASTLLPLSPQAAPPGTRTLRSSPLACSALRATGWAEADAIEQRLRVQQDQGNVQEQEERDVSGVRPRG